LTYRILKTNLLLNWIRLLLVFPVILVNSLLFKIINFYGLEWVITVLVYAILLWFFRVKYSDSVNFGSNTLKISVKTNLLGFYFVRVKLNGEFIKKLTTRNKTFVIEDKDKSLSIRFKIGSDGKTIEYAVHRVKGVRVRLN
jgi:hypothetical protein